MCCGLMSPDIAANSWISAVVSVRSMLARSPTAISSNVRLRRTSKSSADLNDGSSVMETPAGGLMGPDYASEDDGLSAKRPVFVAVKRDGACTGMTARYAAGPGAAARGAGDTRFGTLLSGQGGQRSAAIDSAPETAYRTVLHLPELRQACTSEHVALRLSIVQSRPPALSAERRFADSAEAADRRALARTSPG